VIVRHGTEIASQQFGKEVGFWNSLSYSNVRKLVSILGGIEQYQSAAASGRVAHGIS
jgi:hypothetical protein